LNACVDGRRLESIECLRSDLVKLSYSSLLLSTDFVCLLVLFFMDFCITMCRCLDQQP
jgi:hypothetical protein